MAIKKFCLLHSVSQEAYIIWLWFLVHMCKMMTSLGPFLIFSKFWFSELLEGVKGQKMAQNDKKFHPSHSVSQESNIMWLWFLVHTCKMIISPLLFFIFSKFWFFGFSGRINGKKITQNYQFQSFTFYISETVDHIIKILGGQGQNNDISRCFSWFFLKIQHCKY